MTHRLIRLRRRRAGRGRVVFMLFIDGEAVGFVWTECDRLDDGDLLFRGWATEMGHARCCLHAAARDLVRRRFVMRSVH